MVQFRRLVRTGRQLAPRNYRNSQMLAPVLRKELMGSSAPTACPLLSQIDPEGCINEHSPSPCALGLSSTPPCPKKAALRFPPGTSPSLRKCGSEAERAV